MYQTTILLLAGVLTLPTALSIPCVNPQLGSTSCQSVGEAAASVPDGPTAVADLKMNAPGRRGRPIPTHKHDEPPGITRPSLEGPSGIFRGQDHDEMGPYHLPPGNYQLIVQWIGDFVPGKTTLWVTPSEDDSSLDLLDIVTCPGTSLRHPIHADRPVELDLRITDDYGMPDGSVDRRPSRAQARWWIAADGVGVELGRGAYIY